VNRPQLPTVSVVVLAYGEEPWTEACVEALLASDGVTVDVVVVDNGDLTGAVRRLEGRAGVQVLRPATNLGFAGGCNAGAAVVKGEVLALVNADAIVKPGCLAALAAVALRSGVGLATASIRLADRPDRLNTMGNPVHFLGIVWAGGFDEPAADHDLEQEVPTASGACAAIRRALWDDFGGFDAEYFAYHEDTELSLRCYLQGLSVVYVPTAVVVHRYEFSRNVRKNYLLERNRFLTLLTVYSRRMLFLVSPALVLFELATLLAATAQGWGGAKLRGYWWLLQHGRHIRARRDLVQSKRLITDKELARLLVGRIEPKNTPLPPGSGVLNAALGTYWSLVRRVL